MWPFKKVKPKNLNSVTIIKAHKMKVDFYGLCGMSRESYIIVLGKQSKRPFKSRSQRVGEVERLGYIIDSVRVYPVSRSFYLFNPTN